MRGVQGEQLTYLGQVVSGDVGIVRVLHRVVLMVRLGDVEMFELYQLGGNRARQGAAFVELLDIGAGNVPLFFVASKNGRAILATDIRPLSIQLGRVVGYGKKKHQQATVADLCRIVSDLYRFGMAAGTAAYGFIIGHCGTAAAITAEYVVYANDMLKDRLHSPKAAAGKDGDGRACFW